MVGQWGLSSSEVLSSRGGCQVSHRISPQNPRGTLVPLRCCILYQCPGGSSLGAPLTGTLGRSILPHLLPQQSRLSWKGSQEAASGEEAWGQELPETAGQEVQGGDRGTAAGSCPAWLAAPRCAETRAAVMGREWDTVALVPPTLPAVQREAGGWKICPHLPLSLF